VGPCIQAVYEVMAASEEGVAGVRSTHETKIARIRFSSAAIGFLPAKAPKIVASIPCSGSQYSSFPKMQATNSMTGDQQIASASAGKYRPYRYLHRSSGAAAESVNRPALTAAFIGEPPRNAATGALRASSHGGLLFAHSTRSCAWRDACSSLASSLVRDS